MTLVRTLLLTALAVLVARPAAAGPEAERLAALARQMDAVTRQVLQSPSAPPGLAIVLTAKGEPPTVLVYGLRNAATRAPLTPATPIYIASMTKSYVGTLAAQLDAEGGFDIDRPLGSVWTDLKPDLAQVTFRQWMAHVAPFDNSTLGFRTAYVASIREPEFGRLLRDYSDPRKPGFEYSNTGYVVYRAALEQSGERKLAALIRTRLFTPLGLTRTSMRTSDFPAAELAFAHVQDADGRWRAMPPKPDDLMHAAGGIVTSPQDMGRWLAVNLEPERAGPLAAAIRQAQAQQSPNQANRQGFVCDGYGFGWHRCDYAGIRLFSHGGGYTGFNALMTVSPDAGLGVAVLADGGSGGLAFTTALTKAALDAWQGRAPGPEVVAAIRKPLDDSARRRREAAARIVARPEFEGWRWAPDPKVLDAFAGRYVSPRLGVLQVTRRRDGLHAALGAMPFELKPAKADVFGAYAEGEPDPEVFRFERDASGRIVALMWDDRRFERR